jgi:hypothetical protein
MWPLLLHPFAEPDEVGDGLIDAVLRFFPLGLVHERSALAPAPLAAASQSPHHIEISQQTPGGIRRHRLLRELTSRLQEQQRLLDHTAPPRGRGVSPRGVEVPDLAGRQLLFRHRGRQGLAVAPIGARHGQQVLHRRVGRDAAVTYSFLHRER